MPTSSISQKRFEEFEYGSCWPYYKLLWSKSKKLHSMGKIHNYFISNGTIKIKSSEGSSSLSIAHNSDFENIFLAYIYCHRDKIWYEWYEIFIITVEFTKKTSQGFLHLM